MSQDAETTGGGFPGWVGNIAGSLRTTNSNYTQGLLFEFISTIFTSLKLSRSMVALSTEDFADHSSESSIERWPKYVWIYCMYALCSQNESYSRSSREWVQRRDRSQPVHAKCHRYIPREWGSCPWVVLEASALGTTPYIHISAITHNDQHAGATGNFSPDLPGTGRVNIYW